MDRYQNIAPKGDLILLNKLGEHFRDRSFLHINSTKEGGGVAEILQRMIPLMADIGIDARWDVINGDDKFFDITKRIHNAIQGNPQKFTKSMWDYHFDVNKRNLSDLALEADAYLIHDPQPLPLIEFRENGTWIWRCHIDASNPYGDVCDQLIRYCKKYDSAIFSMPSFARAMGISEFIIPPSIDPLSEKNRELSADEIQGTMDKFNLDPERPMILQVSRFDRFKDPIGVIQAYRLVKKYNDCVLVLAGSPASDDPEGAEVLNEVKEFASDDPDIHILLLPPFSDKDINALQRAATIVMQKSLKEGFGLTVSEAMWKGKPVIGGATGGIPLQIVHRYTGFLVRTAEGAAFRIRQFLNNPVMIERMGEQGREYVRNNFLLTRQTRDYLSVWYTIENGDRPMFNI
ncbi:MAG: glycosyltransferase [Nitrospirota bacterium]|nr:MAG: glycosyltransferase [Nitrospirota bacterium]